MVFPDVLTVLASYQVRKNVGFQLRDNFLESLLSCQVPEGPGVGEGLCQMSLSENFMDKQTDIPWISGASLSCVLPVLLKFTTG